MSRPKDLTKEMKLTDNGESKLWCLEMGSFFSSYNKGSQAWMALEVMGMEKDKRSYTWSVDAYSFGMTCYKILTKSNLLVT